MKEENRKCKEIFLDGQPSSGSNKGLGTLLKMVDYALAEVLEDTTHLDQPVASLFQMAVVHIDFINQELLRFNMENLLDPRKKISF